MPKKLKIKIKKEEWKPEGGLIESEDAKVIKADMSKIPLTKEEKFQKEAMPEMSEHQKSSRKVLKYNLEKYKEEKSPYRLKLLKESRDSYKKSLGKTKKGRLILKDSK